MKPVRRRAQVTIEFSFMVMLAFIFFAIALVVIGFYIQKTSHEQGIALLQDEAARLQQELLLASSVEDGYERNISIPLNLNGLQYSISNTNNMLTLSLADGTTYNKEIPPVVGTFWQPGINTICKTNGTIQLNIPCT